MTPSPDDGRRAVLRDRYRGALLGLAVGDAVGTTVEFAPPGSFPPVTDMTGGGPFSLPAGAWTDDTSMALCLADSLLARRTDDPVDQLQRYVRWYRDGERSSIGTCFDIGNATRQALERFERTGDALPGDHFPDAAGNGGLMRLAPVALAYGFSEQRAGEHAARVSRTTHGDPRATDACRLFAILLVALLNGEDRESLLGPDGPLGWHPSIANLHPEVLVVARGSFRDRQPPEIRGRGFVVASLEAALWALWTTRTFEAAVLAAANLGDDADTTAAIAGQLAGALYGARGVLAEPSAAWGEQPVDRSVRQAAAAAAIPDRWRERVLWGEEIERMADGLLELRAELQRKDPVVVEPHVPDDDPLPNDAFRLLPDVLAGPYPGKPTRAAAEASLDALLRQGITCFVDLTEEGEGPGPRGLHPYEQLVRRLGTDGGVDVWHVRVPIVDQDVPEPWRMRAVLDLIARARAAGQVVYVHCWGGVGRTGTVLACLLIELGLTPEQALERLATARQQTVRAKAGRVAPENDRQRAFVARWGRIEGTGSVPDGPGTVLARAFADSFSTWDVALDPLDVAFRRPATTQKAGWVIHHVWGSEDGVEFLEWYSSHRHPGDDHVRVWADGRTESLDAMSTAIVAKSVEDLPAARKASIERNRRIAAELESKGLLPGLTVNQYLGLAEDDAG